MAGPTVITSILSLLLFTLLLSTPHFTAAAKISVSRGKNATKLDELCARMHNNTALEGTSPLEMMQATAFECQKKCVDMYPACAAVVYYYLHNETKHHYCYLFEENSINTEVELVEQKPEHRKDLVRMLEVVADCHLFDSHPPLEEDGLASSTDKVDRKKRQQGNEKVLGVGDWTDWSACSSQGHEVRTQACEYGRKIQRRGCPARQPQMRFNDAPPRYPQPQPSPQPPRQPYPLDPRSDPRRSQPQPDPRVPQQVDPRQQRPVAPQPDPRQQQPRPQPAESRRSPYDDYARAYQERMSNYRVNQRHPAVPSAAPCPGGNCEPFLGPTIQTPTRAPVPRYRPAPPPPPPCGDNCEVQTIPGNWLEWSDWSACSCTCGDGAKSRRRECETNNCQGPDTETVPCNMGPCQTWSEWCEWSACGATCGQGEKTRTRFCYLGTNRCEGRDFEAERCDAGPCPEWTQWEEWASCSATCGQGQTSRRRTCLGGGAGQCPGEAYETRTCDNGPCSQWSSWQEWGQCSVSCGDGMKRRQRVCQYGTDCQGPAEETLFCYGPPCAQWTEWCEWSSCSSKCGPGQRTRTRGCTTSDGHESHDCQGLSIETIPCEGNNCCSWSEWCHWSMCDKECGGGQSLRTRTCLKNGQPDDSCHCEGPDREEKTCNTQSCMPNCAWTQWCEWSGCSTLLSCEVGLQTRTRQCVGEPGCHCLGMAEDTLQCRGSQPCNKEPPC